MFKHRIVQCPGCQHPFVEGRSIAQHLLRNPICKSFINTSPPVYLNNESAESDRPCVALHITDDVVSSNDFSPADDDVSNSIVSSVPDIVDGDFDGTNMFPAADPDFVHDTFVEPGIPTSAESNLQDVISFPIAFTNAAFHEIKLLKLLHSIGAPNYAFQSFMEWDRNCRQDEYNFQPYPQRYEGQ